MRRVEAIPGAHHDTRHEAATSSMRAYAAPAAHRRERGAVMILGVVRCKCHIAGEFISPSAAMSYRRYAQRPLGLRLRWRDASMAA